MPSSSSAKKVARVAARSGSGSPVGATAGKQRNWLFVVAIVAIVALGGAVVFVARAANEDRTQNKTHPLANLNDGSAFDHWHSAFAINVCGKELPFVAQPATDPFGIHTHGDGLIHIHPFTVDVSGKRAQMKVFFNLVHLKVTNTGFKDPSDGKVYENGVTTCDGKPAHLVMAFWKDGAKAPEHKPDKIYTSNFPQVNYTVNLSAYTLAFVAVGDNNIPAPSSAAEVKTLGECDGATPPPSCSQQSTTGVTTPETVPETIPATIPVTTPKSGSGG